MLITEVDSGEKQLIFPFWASISSPVNLGDWTIISFSQTEGLLKTLISRPPCGISGSSYGVGPF